MQNTFSRISHNSVWDAVQSVLPTYSIVVKMNNNWNWNSIHFVHSCGSQIFLVWTIPCSYPDIHWTEIKIFSNHEWIYCHSRQSYCETVMNPHETSNPWNKSKVNEAWSRRGCLFVKSSESRNESFSGIKYNCQSRGPHLQNPHLRNLCWLSCGIRKIHCVTRQHMKMDSTHSLCLCLYGDVWFKRHNSWSEWFQ